jgi:MFS family permease
VLLWVIALAVLGFGSLMTLVTAALPNIAADMNTTTTTAGWVLTGLMLAMAVGTPAGGKLGDIYGHRNTFLIGLVGMTATMFANYWVWNIEAFIAVRVLFGLSGALLMPSGMALLMDAFGAEQRAKAVGWFQFAMTGAPTLGVVIGGPLLDLLGWRSIFAGFGLVGGLATVLAFVVVKPIPKGPRVSIDWQGALLLASATLLLLLAITRIPSIARSGASFVTDVPTIAMVAASSLLYFGFITWEKRVPSPLLDVRLFTKPTFALPLGSAACSQFAYMGAFVVIPSVLQGPYGYSVGVAALLMVPRPGVFALASPLGGSLVTKVGMRVPMIVGSTAMIGSMLAFAYGSGPVKFGLTFIMVGLILSGISAGIASPAYQTMVANSVEDSQLGIANGMNQTVMWMGMILGIQSMLAFSGTELTPTRLRATFIFAASVAAIGYLAPIFAVRASKKD